MQRGKKKIERKMLEGFERARWICEYARRFSVSLKERI